MRKTIFFLRNSLPSDDVASVSEGNRGYPKNDKHKDYSGLRRPFFLFWKPTVLISAEFRCPKPLSMGARLGFCADPNRQRSVRVPTGGFEKRRSSLCFSRFGVLRFLLELF
jgi:hypothetical protein